MTKINFKNNKTKAATTIIAALAIGLIMLSPTTILPNVQGQASNLIVPNCAKELSSEMSTITDSLDKNKAVSLAGSSSTLKTELGGYNSNFDSIFTQWSWNPSDCSNLKFEDVNIVYDIKNAAGQFVKHVIVREDPSLQNVIKVFSQTSHLRFSVPTTNWSGWELAGNSGATQEVKEANNQWTVPTISVPSGPTYTCIAEPCDVAIWAGLEKGLSSSTTPTVQAGINENITCVNTPCTYQYNSWYQILPSGAPVYSTNTIRPSDSVYADVTNEDKTNSQNQGLYDITVADNTQGNSFSVTGINDKTNMPTANYGIFMLERATQDNGVLTYLASFTNSTTLTGYMYYNGANHCITSSGVSSQNSIMEPGTSINADTSGISCPGSTGNFKEYYHNDNGE